MSGNSHIYVHFATCFGIELALVVWRAHICENGTFQSAIQVPFKCRLYKLELEKISGHRSSTKKLPISGKLYQIWPCWACDSHVMYVSQGRFQPCQRPALFIWDRVNHFQNVVLNVQKFLPFEVLWLWLKPKHCIKINASCLRKESHGWNHCPCDHTFRWRWTVASDSRHMSWTRSLLDLDF